MSRQCLKYTRHNSVFTHKTYIILTGGCDGSRLLNRYRYLVENETFNVRTARIGCAQRLRCAFREHFPCRDVWGQLKSRLAHDARSAYHGDAFRAPRGLEGAGAAIASNAADPPWFYHSDFENLRVGAKSERSLQKTEHFYLFIHLLKHLVLTIFTKFLRNFQT